MEIVVKWKGQDVPIAVDSPAITLGQLKEKVHDATGVPVERQTISGLYKPRRKHNKNRNRNKHKHGQAAEEEESEANQQEHSPSGAKEAEGEGHEPDGSPARPDDALSLAELGVVWKRGKPVRCMLVGSTEQAAESLRVAELAQQDNEEVMNDLDPRPARHVRFQADEDQAERQARSHNRRVRIEGNRPHQGDGNGEDSGLRDLAMEEESDSDEGPGLLPHSAAFAPHHPHLLAQMGGLNAEVAMEDEMMADMAHQEQALSMYQNMNNHGARLRGSDQSELVRLFDQLGDGAGDMVEALVDSHPIELCKGSFMDAVGQAKQRHRLLIALLHNPQSEQCQAFVLQAFTSPLFLDTLQRFVLWCRPAPPADPDTGAHWLQDAHRVLFLTQLPFIGICLCTGSQINLVEVLQDHEEIDEVIARLLTALDVHTPALDDAMARAADEHSNANLRSQQDEEYAEALRLAREREQEEERLRKQQEAEEEKERQAQEALERERAEAAAREAERERQWQERQEQARASLPPEPPVDDKSATALQIRTLDGGRLQRRFPSEAKVHSVVDFLVGEGVDMATCALVLSFPRRVLADLSQTLAEAGLHPSASLFVELKRED